MIRIRYVFFILFFLAVFVSCQKDEDLKEITQPVKVDGANSLSSMATPANVLAVAGTLKITIQDSTYTFDAAKDSIAFVNVYLDDKKYFGITAINKAHTMSFGISSPGYAANNITGAIAGSQLLFSSDSKSNTQYALSQNAGSLDSGKVNLTQYSRDSVLAKGSFTTYLAKDVKVNSPTYKVTGSFDLKRK